VFVRRLLTIARGLTGSDTQLLAKLHDSCAKHPNFVRLDPRRKQTHFGIAHYAGEVVYEISGFLGRNRSATSPDLLHVLEGSKDPFVRLLFGLLAPPVPLSETRSSSSESFNLGSNSPMLPTPSTASPLIVALAVWIGQLAREGSIAQLLIRDRAIIPLGSFNRRRQ